MVPAVVSTASDYLPPDALHDFEIECGEHLTSAQEALLLLSSTPDLATVGPPILDTLFRAFHSIKGLSGMVGAASIEQVAHQLEAYLSAARKGDLPLGEQGVELLFEGVTHLEVACAHFVAGEPAPSAGTLLSGLATLQRAVEPPATVRQEASPAQPGPASQREAERTDRLRSAIARGVHVWNVEFRPSAELAARGINIGSVRQTLGSSGEILSAEPVATPGGIEFRFLVTTTSPGAPASWSETGVIASPYQAPELLTMEAAPLPAKPRAASLVRVELSRLDDLLRSVTDLVISRGRLQGSLERAARHLPAIERRELQETAEAIEQQLRQLREEIMRVRMVPVRDLFTRVRLVVRDLTRQSGKQIELVFAGENTEVDKLLVERLADPLLHLIRNAVSHGIETPAERLAAGKRPEGTIKVRATADGPFVRLEVSDDGRGVQIERVATHAKSRGLIPPDQHVDAASVLDLLCQPGFSTRETADRESGRGVGMDIVRLAIESLGGTLSLETLAGQGTRFFCQLPLTLMVADVLVVRSGGRTYAVAQTSVREVIELAPEGLTDSEHHEFLQHRSRVLPLLRLSDLFDMPRSPSPGVGLVAGEGPQAVVLAVDRVVGLEEAVVRALADPLVQVSGITGATDLGDGRPVLILDPAGLARLAKQRRGLTRKSQR